MRSIEHRFDEVARRRPELSSYACFAQAVRGQGFHPDRLHQKFDQLVDDDDYAPNERNGILRFLDRLTKQPVASEIEVGFVR